MSNVRYFLTVDRMRQGNRGIFCSADGTAFWKENEPHTDNEFFEILGLFGLIMDPKSEPFTEEEIGEYHKFYPLPEYKNAFGIVLKGAFEEENNDV